MLAFDVAAAVMLAFGDHCAEDSSEGQARDGEPVGPGEPLSGFIDECFADVEEDCFYGQGGGSAGLRLDHPTARPAIPAC